MAAFPSNVEEEIVVLVHRMAVAAAESDREEASFLQLACAASFAFASAFLSLAVPAPTEARKFDSKL